MHFGTMLRLAVLATIGLLTFTTGVALATPGAGITVTPLARGTFSEHIKVKTSNIKASIKPSSFVVDHLEIAPGGTTGWHSHPGPAFVVVTEGTFTLYDGDDRECRPHRYGPGQAFVDPGGGHVHIGRNQGTVPVRLVVTFVVPVGAAPRIDVPDPGNCDF